MVSTHIYSVFMRMRSKYLEKLVPADKICMYDTTDIVFQSFALEDAQKYYDSIELSTQAITSSSKEQIEKPWSIIDKYLILTPLNASTTDGFINEECIKHDYIRV